MKKLLLLFLHIFSAGAFSQNLAWAKALGGPGDEQGLSVSTDAAGNVYTTGYFSGTADFDPGAGTYNLASSGKKDIFISKLDASGNFQWARSCGDTTDDSGSSVCNDPAGNVYITGSFKGTVDFDPGVGTTTLVSAGGSDAFVLKLNTSGNLTWARSMGGVNDEQGAAIVLDALGNVYTTGQFAVSGDFDPGANVFTLNTPGAGMFISKLDPSGAFIWAKGVGAPMGEVSPAIRPSAIAVDAAQNVYTTGLFLHTADFDPGIGSFTINPNYNIETYISKLNASGNFVWAKEFKGNFNVSSSIFVDGAANIYLAGFFGSTADFDPGLAVYTLTASGEDIFVTRLDSAGNLAWAKSMGGSGDDAAISLVRDGSGNIYTTGFYKGSTDFDPGAAVYNLNSAGNSDVFISKLSPTGNFIWAKSMGGNDADIGNGITVDVLGNIIVTGYFNSTCDFDPGPSTVNLTAAGGNDIFIAKLGNCTFAITSQPANHASAAGSTVQFVTVTSNTNPVFQWQQDAGGGFMNLTNGGQYSGATTATLSIANIMLAQNNYSLRCIVTEAGCINTSSVALLTVYDATGIREINNEKFFEVYPNPSKDFVTIKTKNLFAGSYVIADETGRYILTGNLENTETRVDMSRLAPGLYFISAGENKRPVKIVKQ